MKHHNEPRYRVLRFFQTTTKTFDIGCGVGLSDLGLNARAFLNSKPPFIELVADGTPLKVARDRPAPTPVPVRPPIEIVADSDPVQSWFRTLALMQERVGGSKQYAEDILFTDAAVRELYRRAQATAYARATAGRRLVSVNLADIGF